MKTYKIIILSAAAGMMLAACNKTDSAFEIPGEKGAFLSIGSARIVAPEEIIVFKSSTDLESDPVPVLEDPESGTFISVTTTVSPMSSDAPQTRVTEKTTSNLGDFTVNGFLGDDILTCRGASDADKSNRHFITNAVASKSNGKWYFGSPAPQWRSCVDHHFWAYDGTPRSFSVPITDASKEVNDFTQASFSYTNDGSEDLIMAYQHHYWVDEKDGTKIDNEDAYPIENLKFQHALSEVVIDFSELVFMQIRIYGDDQQEYVLCSDYPADDPKMNPRLSVTDIKMMTPSKGTCNATVGNNGLQFDWTCSTDSTDYIALDCTDVVGSTAKTKSMFVIPQSPQNNVVMFMIYDKWRDITTPFFIQLPALSDNAEWQPGYRYTYKLQGTLVAPYYTPLGYFDTGFEGKKFQSVAVMKNLMSKYVKEIKITWKGLAVVNSNDTPEALVYETGNNKPTEDNYPMEDYEDTDEWKDNGNVGFLTNCLHNVIANPPKVGEILVVGTNAIDYQCRATFTIPDTFDPPITLWLLYHGDNNGNALWKIKDMEIEVTKFKSPIQIIP